MVTSAPSKPKKEYLVEQLVPTREDRPSDAKAQDGSQGMISVRGMDFNYG
ncbi:MAG: hypothetical protein RL693_2491, partial [Verrucomicrobiota bacterium]